MDLLLLAQADVPSPRAELDAFLGNPLLLGFGALIAAWLAGRALQDQARRMGLDDALARQVGPDGPEFRWSVFFGAGGFWLVLMAGLLGIASRLSLPVVGDLLQSAVELLLRGLLGGGILAAAVTFAGVLSGPDAAPDAARGERRTVLLVGAVLAVAAVTGLSLGTWLLLGLIAVPIVLLARSPRHRGRAAAALEDLAAGLRLRGQVNADGPVPGASGARLAGALGPLRTWIVQDRRRRLLRNSELLALVEGPAAASLTPTDPVEDDAADA